ncbi:MAG: type II toxin-antitoxin system PemK/MazF family toxin [Candidatus Pacebacteria bacterium]|nr:type II toxin-antitoxin system PemK/MazF family toxin [Candidatus Paceibacterota bacterium]
MSIKKGSCLWHWKGNAIEENDNRVYFHEREVWFCHLGTNIGYEQDGKGVEFGRPIIVFRKFNNEMCWAIPLTTKVKTGKFYMSISLGDDLPRMAILSQLRVIDGKRLYQKIGVVNNDDYLELTGRIIALCRGNSDNMPETSEAAH